MVFGAIDHVTALSLFYYALSKKKKKKLDVYANFV